MSHRFAGHDPEQRARGTTAAMSAIKRGELVVMCTDTAYGLACDAFNPLATSKLRAARGQGPGAPIPVMIARLSTVDGVASAVSPAARDLMRSGWPGGLTVVVRQQPSLSWDVGDGSSVSLRIPLHPWALQLLDMTGPLAVAAASLAGSGLPSSCDEAQAALGENVTVYLDGGPCLDEPPSSIVDAVSEPPRLLREGALSLERLRFACPELIDGRG